MTEPTEKLLQLQHETIQRCQSCISDTKSTLCVLLIMYVANIFFALYLLFAGFWGVLSLSVLCWVIMHGLTIVFRGQLADERTELNAALVAMDRFAEMEKEITQEQEQ